MRNSGVLVSLAHLPLVVMQREVVLWGRCHDKSNRQQSVLLERCHDWIHSVVLPKHWRVDQAAALRTGQTHNRHVAVPTLQMSRSRSDGGVTAELVGGIA